MNETVNAINENKIIAMNTEISNYYDRISNVFDQIDFEMNDLNDYLIGSSYNKVFDNYKRVRSDFPKIKQGINNYAEDYACLVRKMKTDADYIARLFEDYTRKLQSDKNKTN